MAKLLDKVTPVALRGVTVSEAEYAYQRRKRVIPLMMEPSYSPDGWLGIILGSKLWMDFRKDPSIGIQQLMKEISKARGGMLPICITLFSG